MRRGDKILLLCMAIVYVCLMLGCQKLSACPEPPALAWPELSIVTMQTPDADVARAYVVNQNILKARLAEALELLNGYRSKTPQTQVPR